MAQPQRVHEHMRGLMFDADKIVEKLSTRIFTLDI